MIEPMDSKLFASKLGSSLSYWIQQKKRVVWIKLHIRCFDLVCPALEEGFWYDHAKPDCLMLVNQITEMFSKILTETDIRVRLTVPTQALEHINMPEGANKVSLSLRDSKGRKWPFQCYTRPTGHPKPAFIAGWLDFVRAKGLQIGDKVTFSKLGGEAGGGPLYSIHAKRWRAITLMGVEVVDWVDQPPIE